MFLQNATDCRNELCVNTRSENCRQRCVENSEIINDMELFTFRHLCRWPERSPLQHKPNNYPSLMKTDEGFHTTTWPVLGSRLGLEMCVSSNSRRVCVCACVYNPTRLGRTWNPQTLFLFPLPNFSFFLSSNKFEVSTRIFRTVRRSVHLQKKKQHRIHGR